MLVNAGTSYNAVVAAMSADQVDAIEVGPFAFVIAEHETNTVPIEVGAAQTSLESTAEVVYNPDILPFYYSLFIKKTAVKPLPLGMGI